MNNLQLGKKFKYTFIPRRSPDRGHFDRRPSGPGIIGHPWPSFPQRWQTSHLQLGLRALKTHICFTYLIAIYVYLFIRSRGSSVAIATAYGLGGWGSNTGRGKVSVFSTRSRPALGLTKPAIQWAARDFPGGLSGRGVILTTNLHLVPSQKWWSYTSTTKYVFMAWCLIN
jgi:hypothetical protein